MRVDLFDFELPEDRIALAPGRAARCGAAAGGQAGAAFEDGIVRDLPSLLEPGDVLVFNDTKVIPAQLSGIRRRGEAVAQIDATLHMRIAPDRWKAFVRPAKRLAVGDRINFGHDGNSCFLGQLDATVVEKGEAGEVTLAFDLSGAFLDEALHAVGHIPLPPYIASKRPDDERDRSDYQTIYAREEGAVAAPTAGLHFTPELFDALDRRGIERAFVTLHVGAGTFLPVKADDTADHKMHAESGTISGETAAARSTPRGRVATASLRSARRRCGCSKALPRRTASSRHGPARPTSSSRPATAFRIVDALMTNFHLPRSTLFMLVSAFSGLETMRAYAHASSATFYSYGDASLLFSGGTMTTTQFLDPVLPAFPTAIGHDLSGIIDLGAAEDRADRPPGRNSCAAA